MEYYQMTDVIDLLNIPAPPNGQSSYYVHCPCCDENPRKRHLNINLQKNVFRCPRCGVSGGIFDLYSLFTGVPRKEVRLAIAHRMGMPEYVQRPKRAPSTAPAVIECPIIDVDIRHATYSALLSKLSLAPDHRDNLHKRGLTDDEIDVLGYRTTPVLGHSSIAAQLQSEGYYLSGVPGFYRLDNDAWTLVHEERGILIPARDINGKIQGLQIRRDDAKKGKFRWLSSRDRKDGCHASGWTHMAGKAQGTVLITEGPMKADIINLLSGCTVLAVPGVNVQEQLQLTLKLLHKDGVKEIKTAFDMDMATKSHVQKGYNSLLSVLSSMGFQYGTYVWDPRYKGLDDYIWEHCLEKQRS